MFCINLTSVLYVGIALEQSAMNLTFYKHNFLRLSELIFFFITLKRPRLLIIINWAKRNPLENIAFSRGIWWTIKDSNF